MRLNAGVRAFLWVVKAPARLRTELAERYRQPPEPGSVIIADEQESWTAVAPNLNANDAANDGRAIRWMIVAGGPGTSLLDLGEGEDSNLATGQVMTEMRRRFLRRRQAYLAWLLTDLVLVAWRRYVAGERRLRHNVTAADITAVLPDIWWRTTRSWPRPPCSWRTGLNTVAQLVGNGPAYRKMALRWFVKFAGEQIYRGGDCADDPRRARSQPCLVRTPTCGSFRLVRTPTCGSFRLVRTPTCGAPSGAKETPCRTTKR